MSEDTNWKNEIKEVGKTVFELEDMRKLGFLEIDDQTISAIAEKEKEYYKLLGEERNLNKEIDKELDIRPHLEKIRQKRIERVAKKREERKKEKAIQEAERKRNIQEKLTYTPSYLGDEISTGLNYNSEKPEKLENLQLPSCPSLKELEDLSKIPAKQWQWLAFHKKVSKTDHYVRFNIPKKNGKLRAIASPKKQMRNVQTWIKESILDKIEIHNGAMAFRPNRSIVDNALAHKDAKILVRIDFKDFFPSIKFSRVKGIFKSFGYNNALSTIFASVCTDSPMREAVINDQKYKIALQDKALPQGACTSPAITNILCRQLDARLEGLCQKNEWTYTRYADDIVISTQKDKPQLKGFLKWVYTIIEDEGLIINHEKTMIMRPHQRQSVTGIVVNGANDIRISRKDIRRMHSFIHHLLRNETSKLKLKNNTDPYLYLMGYINFVRMVNSEQADGLIKYMGKLKE